MGHIYLEIFGYIGTALVITSMMMTSVTKLRLINICGGVISAIYSVFYGAWAVVIMNVCLVIINIFQLIRQAVHKPAFVHIISNTNDSSVRYFLSLHSADIEKLFPDYRFEEQQNTEVHMVYIGDEAVGILIGGRTDGIFNIDMEYESSKYKGAIMDKFLFPTLKESGINTVNATVNTKAYGDVLTKRGFAENDGIMQKAL